MITKSESALRCLKSQKCRNSKILRSLARAQSQSHVDMIQGKFMIFAPMKLFNAEQATLCDLANDNKVHMKASTVQNPNRARRRTLDVAPLKQHNAANFLQTLVLLTN